ncbi:hypothetical protein RB195_009968 [Necator americanus]|uniref:Uncharacterized protein n=1 Tax=Necator americanus TaxID=51031 RepID=A0ABR1CVQ7_NECAM
MAVSNDYNNLVEEFGSKASTQSSSKSKKMRRWDSTNNWMCYENGTRVDGQRIEFVHKFCNLGCMLRNNGSYEKDVVATPYHQQSQAARLPTRYSPHHDVRIGDLGSTVYGGGEA